MYSLIAQLVKNPPAIRMPRFNSWVGKICCRGNGNPLQYSCLDTPLQYPLPMHKGARQATVNSVTKGRTRPQQLSTSVLGSCFSDDLCSYFLNWTDLIYVPSFQLQILGIFSLIHYIVRRHRKTYVE